MSWPLRTVLFRNTPGPVSSPTPARFEAYAPRLFSSFRLFILTPSSSVPRLATAPYALSLRAPAALVPAMDTTGAPCRLRIALSACCVRWHFASHVVSNDWQPHPSCRLTSMGRSLRSVEADRRLGNWAAGVAKRCEARCAAEAVRSFGPWQDPKRPTEDGLPHQTPNCDRPRGVPPHRRPSPSKERGRS
jgi:hypothetical protein